MLTLKLFQYFKSTIIYSFIFMYAFKPLLLSFMSKINKKKILIAKDTDNILTLI